MSPNADDDNLCICGHVRSAHSQGIGTCLGTRSLGELVACGCDSFHPKRDPPREDVLKGIVDERWKGIQWEGGEDADPLPLCSVCLGGTPLPGKPCICGGTGTIHGELDGFRKALFDSQGREDDARDFYQKLRALFNTGACCDCHLHPPDGECVVDCKPNCTHDRLGDFLAAAPRWLRGRV